MKTYFTGTEKYGTVILVLIVLVGSAFVLYEWRKSRLIRKHFNFWKEMKKIKNKTPKVQHDDSNSTLLGYNGRKPVLVPDDCKHCIICGTTGSGKTIAVSNFIKRAIDKNYPALIVDGKGDIGDGSILNITQRLCKDNNKKLYVINMTNPEQSDKYNPFLGASPTVAKDMIINMTDWSEEHYQMNVDRYLQRTLYLLSKINMKLSFKRIIQHMNIDRFTDLSAKLLKSELVTKDEHVENMEIANTSGKIAQSSIARFASIAESDVGHIFDDKGINISQALQEKAIILFVLNPLIYPELSPAFGRLILIDSKMAVNTLFSARPERVFYIFDEVNVYASPVLLDLINKSRSANITCFLSFQSLADLEASVSESFREQIIENTNNYILLRQNSSINAEHWAGIFGTRPSLEVTYQMQQQSRVTTTTGLGSARRVREFIYHPDEIKSLKVGKGLFLSKDYSYHCKVNISKPV